MKLNQMFHNVLNYSLEVLTAKVEEDSIKRTAALEAAATKIDMAPKSRSSLPKLSDSEKAILKALGLNIKAIKMLQGV